MSSKPEFLYFNGSGRVIPARIALFAAFGKDGWVNETIDFATFKEEQDKLAKGVEGARLVSGALPQIRLPSGETFCQTLSIARWACIWAIRNGVDIQNLYPINNPDQFIIMDEAMTFAMEILDKCPRDPNAEIMKKKREEYISENGFMGKAMKILEKRLSHSPGNFLLGNQPCLADFTIYTLTNMVSIGMFDHVPNTYVQHFSSLSKHMEAIRECDLMKKYVEAFGGEP